jgi:hypothetical protein
MKYKYKYFLFIPIIFIINSCENINGSNFNEEQNISVLELNEISQLKINTDTINITSGKNPEDSVRINISVKLSEYIVNNSNSQIESFKYILINTEKSEDEISGFFSSRKNISQNKQVIIHEGNIYFTTQRKNTGNYLLKIFGCNSDKRISNFVLTNLILFRENHKPWIEKVYAPDTIIISEGIQKYKLIAKVSDYEGLVDIKKVFFNSYKPDGSASNGNPFTMYDDGDKNGISGDDIAGDGLYSLTIQITPQNPKETYRFDFYAMDKSDSLSNVYSHYITVK